MQYADGRTAGGVVWRAIGPGDEIHGRIADAEPKMLVFVMMPQVIFLHPPANAGARLVWNVGDVMDPFIMQERQHRAEYKRYHDAPIAEQHPGDQCHKCEIWRH